MNAEKTWKLRSSNKKEQVSYVAISCGKTDTKPKWVPKLNSIVLLFKKNFSRVHCFGISIRQTLPQFNVNLMNHFNKGKRYEEIITITILEFENKKATSKIVAIAEKKENNVSEKSYIPTKGI